MSRTSIHLTIATFACLIACGALGVLFWRVHVEGTTLVAALQNEREGIAKADAYRDARTHLALSEDERTILNTYVLGGDEDAVSLLSLIETAANGLGVTLTTDQLSEVDAADPGFNELQLTLTLSGHNGRVLDMLRMLETLPYQSRVSTVRFDRSRDAASGAYEAKAQVTLFVSMKE